MPNQPPSDQTHAAGGPQYHLAPCTRRGFKPILPDQYAKRTQSTPRRTCGGPKIRNEPNLPLPQPAPQRKNTKRTQFRPANRQKQTANHQKTRNEPNLPYSLLLLWLFWLSTRKPLNNHGLHRPAGGRRPGHLQAQDHRFPQAPRPPFTAAHAPSHRYRMADRLRLLCGLNNLVP